ncbi:MAG TPA: HAMP domain-containing sensor histidine kinase [Candidatus Nitrosotalea sp.]|nr:HAMP domain-containing sensor histidine kinase [Candidatus Nitrosotalea sp.]
MLIERCDDIDNSKLEKYFTPQNHAQTEFANIASHEMKTSIQAILTYSELLQNKHDEFRENYVKAILRNALRLKVLSNNLCNLTRIDGKILKLKKERLDLNLLVSSIANDFENMNRYHDYKQEIKVLVISSKHIFVEADKERLEQVIFNLLDNAIKFTNKGTIQIKLENISDENWTEITITDTGPGIDDTIMPNLFNKFVTSSYHGTGLGLYICKNIIEAHNGKIWAKNNTNKKGASITCRIPTNQELTNRDYTKFLNLETVS